MKKIMIIMCMMMCNVQYGQNITTNEHGHKIIIDENGRKTLIMDEKTMSISYYVPATPEKLAAEAEERRQFLENHAEQIEEYERADIDGKNRLLREIRERKKILSANGATFNESRSLDSLYLTLMGMTPELKIKVASLDEMVRAIEEEHPNVEFMAYRGITSEFFRENPDWAQRYRKAEAEERAKAALLGMTMEEMWEKELRDYKERKEREHEESLKRQNEPTEHTPDPEPSSNRIWLYVIVAVTVVSAVAFFAWRKK